MSIELKAGSMADFFAAARETAMEIDAGRNVARKNRIWVDPADLLDLLRPEQTGIVHYLRERRRVFFAELMADMQRSPESLNNDLAVLLKYQLIRIFSETGQRDEAHRVIEAAFGTEKIQVMAEI